MSSASLRHARWSLDAGTHEHVVFAVEGMRCSACARSIERAIAVLPGVDGVRVNGATARVAVDWTGAGPTDLAQILAAVERAGFAAVPLAGAVASAEYQRERRVAIKRIGLAALGMMQAMMYLGALYGASDISPEMAGLMRIAGMIIVTPVLFYSGAPFLGGAWRDLAQRRLGMDVPVAMALLLAWFPSVYNTLRGSGEIYFDSIAMFVFFLSAGRFIEMSLRHRGLIASEALSRSLPAHVMRVDAAGERVRVTLGELAVGERFFVPTGGVVAVDAELPADAGAEVAALLDESLLTGESAAMRRKPGERIRGGSLNVGAPLTLVATETARSSTLASMVALLERAQAERPRLARVADRVASWFVALVLVLALATGIAWYYLDAARAFPAVLAVLVVTCPCALSLAAPAALAAASTALARCGLLVLRADAIERLASVDTVVLDKTGTLTGSETAILDVMSTIAREDALALAAALERGSSHPLAAAFVAHARAGQHAQSLREVAGEGLEGTIDGVRWRLGRREFAGAIATAGNVRMLVPWASMNATMYLGGPMGLVAALQVGAPLRPDARAAVAALRQMGMRIILASGDSKAAVADVAYALDVPHALARLTPQEKIRLVASLRAAGRRVFMIGDGINDGPVLAAADVSCAMGQGSAIAQSASDLLLAHENLAALPRAIELARRAIRVMRQNLAWSLAYNLAAVPLAACGLISPWIAALGMSLSSLAVVLNARRLASGVPR